MTTVSAGARGLLTTVRTLGADYALLASTEWPGVEPPDVEHGDIDALIEAYPDYREEIRAVTGHE
jgi:hypothetical protein